jgi:peptidoglycan hydrolase-like protein with peptidoglycan-binding domain
MELVAYLHSEMLCERLQQGESIDQTLDCQLLDSIAQSSRHAKSVLCVGLAVSAIAINAMPIAAFAFTPEVASIQQLLARRGFKPGAIDGVKGASTTEAIIAAQTFYKLNADGMVGAQTIAALEADTYEAPVAATPVAATPVTATPVTATPVTATSVSVNSDNKSDAVKNLQQLLSDRGFYGGAIDGVSGPMTKEAIILAQKTYGLVADGVAGSLTIAALEAGSNYVPKSSVASTKSDAVKNLQQLLSDRGFYGGAIDGVSGPMTKEAIILAQKNYGLVADGVAGSLTMAALESGSKVVSISYKQPASQEAVSNVADSSIKKGQTLLSNLGLYDGAIDGIQGSKTTAAIKKAQELYGLPVDGVLNSQTLVALQS